MSDNKRNCSECRFAIFRDYGYSNWTVEGTQFMCAKRLHPDDSFDRFYNVNPKLEYAEKCDGFVEGIPVDMDVDEEKMDDLTSEEKEVWDMYWSAPARKST